MKKGERKRKKKKESERSEHITKDTEREAQGAACQPTERRNQNRTTATRDLRRRDGGRLVGDSLLLCQLADTRPGRTQSGSPHAVRSARGASGGQAGILRELGSVTERRWHCEIGCTR